MNQRQGAANSGGGSRDLEHDVDAFDENGVDVSLIRWMLGMTPTERLQVAQDMIDTVWELRSAPRSS